MTSPCSDSTALGRAARRRVASAAGTLTLLAGTIACFPSPPPPEAEVCDTPEAEATIDGVAVACRFERGAQGTLMVVADVEWVGDGAPACAAAELRLLDERGEQLQALAPALETEPTDEGRRSTSGVFFLLDDESICSATVEIDSYGHHDSVEVENPGGYDCGEAGVADDAG